MTYFTLLFFDGSKHMREAETKDDMIADFCKDDCTQFQEKVKEIHWFESGYQYIEDIYTGEIKKIIAPTG